ncbi:MAG: hypothetical protein A3K67_02485 [Euryarchaeota archaeon RBG_16_62_10]|nr:MAG: hypothetical protein A3K67_02485 [Euryarchaeota archaeon RBG_16_62_10]
MRFDPSIDIASPPEVYNPSDDSFLLLESVEVRPGQEFLEVGCGTGIVSLHAAKAGARVTAADISPHAVECTRRNAAKNGLKMRVLESDLFEKVSGNFDVIAFNPPYLPGETRSTSWVERAWSGGSEGSETTVRFMEQAWAHMSPGARAYLILSSVGGLLSVLQAASERYSSELIEERHMFFESIYAYRFALKSSGASQEREKL